MLPRAGRAKTDRKSLQGLPFKLPPRRGHGTSYPKAHFAENDPHNSSAETYGIITSESNPNTADSNWGNGYYGHP